MTTSFPAYRIGTHNSRNVYRVANTGNHLDDVHIACVFDPDDGELVATALSCFAAALDRATDAAAGNEPGVAGGQLADAMRDAIDFTHHGFRDTPDTRKSAPVAAQQEDK
jgi:hypothetical protein